MWKKAGGHRPPLQWIRLTYRGRNMRMTKTRNFSFLSLRGVYMKAKLAAVLVGTGLLLAGRPLIAHHAFAAEFDADKPITLTGAVTKIQWTNPHAWFYID